MITVTGSLAFDTIMDFPGKFGDHIMPDKIHQINLSFTPWQAIYLVGTQ